MANGSFKMSVDVDARYYVAAVAQPGDTVLIGFSHSLTDEEIDALDESFKPIIKQGIKIGFMDQVTSMVVVKGDREPCGHECNKVQALDENDEPLDFVHCGICGKVEDVEEGDDGEVPAGDTL